MISFHGLKRIEAQEATAGNLVAFSGFPDANVGDTNAHHGRDLTRSPRPRDCIRQGAKVRRIEGVADPVLKVERDGPPGGPRKRAPESAA